MTHAYLLKTEFASAICNFDIKINWPALPRVLGQIGSRACMLKNTFLYYKTIFFLTLNGVLWKFRFISIFQGQNICFKYHPCSVKMSQTKRDPQCPGLLHFFVTISIPWHFEKLIGRPIPWDQATILSHSSCKWSSSLCRIKWRRVMSSAYFITDELLLTTDKLSKTMQNKRGPMTLPWGTPDVTQHQLD